tara:strand:- start:201 stop:365 length:165 start_codon:yes stop_codon:yes gene_type:complete
MIWIWFLLAVVAGFVLTWYSITDDYTTGFKVFNDEEEVKDFHKACFDGMRKGVQ